MTERIPKIVIVMTLLSGAALLAYLAFSQPAFFSNQTYLAGLVLLEILLLSIWMYRRVFFPVTVVAFLLAGMQLPLASIWTVARWLILSVGALVGLFIMLKEHRHRVASFHLLALFSVLAALVSAAVSQYTVVSFLKVLSLFLLFL